jgi:hypothetical protein
LEVLEIVGQNTEAGLKRLAPSHSFGAAMKSNEAEKRRELAEETGTAMIEKDPVKNLREFLKRKKARLVQSMLPPPLSALVLRRLVDLSNKNRARMTSIHTPQTMGSCSCLLSRAMCLVHWMLGTDHLWQVALLKRIGCTTRARILVEAFVNSCRKRRQIRIESSPVGARVGGQQFAIRKDLKKSTNDTFSRTWA